MADLITYKNKVDLVTDTTTAEEYKWSAADANMVKTAINNLNNNKQDALPKGTYTGNINNIRKTGCYWCDFSAVTGSPYTSGYGWLEVVKHDGGETCLQKIYRFSAGINVIAIRPYTNGQWYAWRTVLTNAI